MGHFACFAFLWPIGDHYRALASSPTCVDMVCTCGKSYCHFCDLSRHLKSNGDSTDKNFVQNCRRQIQAAEMMATTLHSKFRSYQMVDGENKVCFVVRRNPGMCLTSVERRYFWRLHTKRQRSVERRGERESFILFQIEGANTQQESSNGCGSSTSVTEIAH